MPEFSREFLEEVWQLAKKRLPGWAYASLLSEARPRAGGRASHRLDAPNILEKVALAEIRPSTLKEMPDDELSVVWLRLNQWFKAARRRNLPTEDIVNAALWAMNELRRRDVEIKPSDLTAAVDSFRETSKGGIYKARMKKLPQEVIVVRDFVSVVGSMAKDDPEPTDLDVLVRAEWDKEAGHVHVGADNIWLPIRNVLDPSKRGDLHWISGAQGAHDDCIPLYDLVLRKRETLNSEVFKGVKIVRSIGPKNAPLALVGASPSKLEWDRGEPFCGECKETLEEKYLKPLGLSRKQVVLTNTVPEFLVDDKGRAREPNAEEADQWKDWVLGELDALNPGIVIALGQSAGRILDERTDFVLPHPSAVHRFGDSGEVARKLKQIKRRMSEVQKQEEGGETRGETSQRLWEKEWSELLPKSGKGKFVYQHHWRGLEEDEAKLSDRQLLNTDHSLHGDIRLEGAGGLWGWAVMLGTAAENAKAGGDRLIALKEDEKLRLAPKLLQPKEWLNVGKPEGGTVQKPGEPGSTSKTYSKFFALDHGTYQIGVVLQNAIEIFLDGKHLNGRYMITYPRLDGERVWLIDKPKTQTPRAETDDLADIISEQKQKGRRYVVWAKPGERPVKYDARTGEVIKSELSVLIAKTDPVKRIVYGVVIDPYGKSGPEPDAHNDWIPPADVESTAHGFLKGSRVIGMRHKTKANAVPVESWIEPYPSREEYLKAMRGEPHKVWRRSFGDDVLHSGAWVLGVELGEDEWEEYENGDINAFSPGGVGFRSPITPGMMPKVQFVDLVPKEA